MENTIIAAKSSRRYLFCIITIIQIYFVGEEAVDTGGPRREFWRLLLLEAQEKYCIGSEGEK